MPPPNPAKQVKVVQTTKKSRGSDATTPSKMKQHDDTRPLASTSHDSVPPTRPNSPVLPPCNHAQKVITSYTPENPTLKGLDSAEGKSNQGTKPATGSSVSKDDEPEKTRASKMSYLATREVWDRTLCLYKTLEGSPEKLDKNDEYLFVVRTRIGWQTQKATVFIDIKSKPIRDMIREVLKDVRVVSLKEDKPSIEQQILFNFLGEIVGYCSDKARRSKLGDVASKHLDVLLSYLQPEYKPLETRLDPMLKAGEITYDMLWTIFKPNAEIFTTCSGTGVPRCVRCRFGEERKRNNGSMYFHIECHYLNSDGDLFGEATTVMQIDEFRGAKPINMLRCYPLVYHRQSTRMRQQLVDRGKKFMSLLGVHHLTYEGKAFHINDEGNMVITFVRQSRIMVDASFFFKHNPNYRRARIEPSFNEDNVDESHNWGGLFACGVRVPFETDDVLQPVNKDPKSMSEDELLICSPTVYGFSLQLKTWLEFAVAYVGDIKWDDTCFNRLVLPPKTVQVIQALCKTRLSGDENSFFEDFVVGKGRGLVILLHGPPGVGKTLTAEMTSEFTRRPFYTISAGELGTNPTDLEHNLTYIFGLVCQWKATLLFDEADVFLEQRSTRDIHRNALVSVFLRKLEYYEGVLFLTTNRVETIDEAFGSRIHLPLRYDPLKETDRKKLWQGNLAKAITPHGKPKYMPSDLEALARKQLNGREITNATSTAQSLAAFENTVVTVDHLMGAISNGEQFKSDFKGAGHFANERSYL